MNVDLKEFRAAFVAEAEEHLTVVQSLLLDIERGLREGRPSPRELRELMRLLHTVKGLSAMVGVESIVTLAHRMESVVRAAERSGGMLQERAIEVVLEATKAIESRVRAVAEERPVPLAPPDLLVSLDSLEPPPAAPIGALPLDPVIAAKLGTSEQQQLRAGARGGRRGVRVDFAPSADKAERGETITIVRERLSAIAEIVKVLPLTLPATGDAPAGLVFALVLLTDATDTQIAAAVGVGAEDVTLLVAPELEGAPTSLAPVVLETDDDDYNGGRGVLRVEVSRVDDAIDMLGGLVVTRSRMAHAVDRLESNGADTRELRSIMLDNTRQLRELRGAILRVRMIPMAAVLERLPLVARGLSRATGKQVRVELDMGSAELDKTVAERLFPALVHLMRNAVDHGIEPPTERMANGKPETATITIKSITLDRSVEIRFSDDGRGVDRAAIAARAAQPVPTNNAALLDLMCRTGLSTRAEVDTTSGRGLGMDIVRKIVVHHLGGELSIESREGGGTTFVLRVPLTVAIVDAFTIHCAGQRFAIPVPIVEEIIELREERVIDAPTKSGPRMLAWRGDTVAVFDLAQALSLPSPSNAAHGVVVRRGVGELVAYAVERVLGQQEIVVRPLVDPLVASSAVSGSTDLGDGHATVVLDLLALASTLQSKSGKGHAA